MKKKLKLSLIINEHIIYKFLGQINGIKIVTWANEIEKILIANGATKDKIQNVLELFIETLQNILHYAHPNTELKEKGVSCEFSLLYFTKNDTYILESCNFIKQNQKNIIEKKLSSLKGLDSDTLRKMIRRKGRSKEDSHLKGAGLGYIIMTRKTSAPIEIEFLPYREDILKYKQRLFI